MAERIIRVLVDDLDHTEITDGQGGSITFALGDTAYTIDLNDGNKAKLEDALAPFIAAATRTSGPERPEGKRSRGATGGTRRRKATRRKPRAAGRSSAHASNTVIRSWAVENGYSVSPKGRISRSVVDAYNEAHS